MAGQAAAVLGDVPRVVAGRYELGQMLGAGSSAGVYRARDRRTGAVVAIKYFRPDLSERDLRQHRQEMEALAGLSHPGLVRLYDGGHHDGCPYLVTDLIEGTTLARRIADGPPLAPGVVRRLGTQLADALAHVHAAGMVHRDMKPANVLIGPGGRPKLVDFGISRPLDATSVTANGCVVGTAAYLAPEQVRGERVGPATDVYALGLVLLEAITGRREFPGQAVESATARLYRSPKVPDGLPAGLGTVLAAMTRDDPSRRPSAAAVAAALAADPTSPAAALAPAVPPSPRGAPSGRHRLCRQGGRPITRAALVAATVLLTMLTTAAQPFGEQPTTSQQVAYFR